MKTKTILKKVASVALVMALACSLFAGVGVIKAKANVKFNKEILTNKSLSVKEGAYTKVSLPKPEGAKTYTSFAVEKGETGLKVKKINGGKSVKVILEYKESHTTSESYVNCYYTDKKGQKLYNKFRIALVPRQPYIMVNGKKTVFDDSSVYISNIKMKSTETKTFVIENELEKDVKKDFKVTSDYDCLTGTIKSKGKKPALEIKTTGCESGTKEIAFIFSLKKGKKYREYTVHFFIEVQ